MPRLPLILALLLVLLASSAGIAVAQEASPVASDSPFAALDATPLPLTVADDGSVEAPAELAAGLYEVTLDNPTDLTVDLLFVMAPGGGGTDELMAMPMDEALGVPGWFYSAVIAGGVSAAAQSSDRAVVELTQSGAWTIAVQSQPADGNAAPIEQLVPLTISGDYAATGDDSAIPTVELIDFDFTFPAELQAGEQVWKVSNAGEHPHHLVLLKADSAITEGRIQQILEIEMGMGMPIEGATPQPTDAEGAAAATTLQDVAYAQVLSPGRSAYISVTLEDGFYVALCFVVDPETNQPHALMGMIEVLEVGGTGDTPGVATPAS